MSPCMCNKGLAWVIFCQIECLTGRHTEERSDKMKAIPLPVRPAMQYIES